MSENEQADELPRRRFLRISSLAGASSFMVGIETGSATSQTATTQTTNRSTTTQKTNTTQATGESTTSQTSSGRPNSTLSATSCGSPSDSGGRFVLWDKVQVCEGKKTQPQTNCLVNDSDYVVLNGGANTTHDYLLVPTRRISGIECPLIWDQNAPNYWQDAWMQATKTGGAAEVKYNNIGLGINSKDARSQDQLHIHMAGILSGVKDQLAKVDNQITTNLEKWKDQIVQVKGRDQSSGNPETRSYRAVHVPDLQQNLFRLLRDNVVKPESEKMGDQTIVVTPRLNGGFYRRSSPSASGLDPEDEGRTLH